MRSRARGVERARAAHGSACRESIAVMRAAYSAERHSIQRSRVRARGARPRARRAARKADDGLQARADCPPAADCASCRRATAATRLRPSPVPGELRLASSRTKRSTTRARSSPGMPGPVSATRSSTPCGVSAAARRVTCAAWRRVFDRVVDQIGERLRDQAAIAVDHRRAGRR